MTRAHMVFAGAASGLIFLLVSAGPLSAEDVDPKYERRSDYKAYAADKGPNAVDVSGFPAAIQEVYPLFAARCGKCHPLARAINTDKDTLAWVHYVKRMSEKPESGLSPAAAKKVYKFIKYFQTYKDQQKKRGG